MTWISYAQLGLFDESQNILEAQIDKIFHENQYSLIIGGGLSSATMTQSNGEKINKKQFSFITGYLLHCNF